MSRVSARTAAKGKSVESRADDRQRWDDLWNGGGRKGYRCTVISEFVKIHQLQRKDVLEVGCGDRNLDRPGSLKGNFFGGDISMVALRGAKSCHPKANFAQLEATHLPFRDGAFQAVVSFGTMHHYGPDALSAIEEMRRVSSRAVIFTVEHEESLPARLKEEKRILHKRTTIGGYKAIAPVHRDTGKPIMDDARLFFNEVNLGTYLTGLGFSRIELIVDRRDGWGSGKDPLEVREYQNIPVLAYMRAKDGERQHMEVRAYLKDK
ncbi:MAG: class I SAM-dependent methyltransferase [Candidatus Micrarchaeota archaeon]|nr:class I SAM-dependent methyltransferase [Candidatus Micrarchaeota archaeon]